MFRDHPKMPIESELIAPSYDEVKEIDNLIPRLVQLGIIPIQEGAEIIQQFLNYDKLSSTEKWKLLAKVNSYST